jgi:rare lipoprotein A
MRLSHPTFRYILVLLIYTTCLACAVRPTIYPGGTQYPKGPQGSSEFPLHHTQEGIASWYGADFQGRRTANGEIYDMYKITAAHRYLPLGCYTRVTNLRNEKAVVVKINDRGPFVKDRILDLSYGAACALGMAMDGLAPVRIELVQLPEQPGPEGGFFIQIGAFSYRANADRLQQKLSSYYPTHLVIYQRPDSSQLYRVWIGPFDHISSAQKTLQKCESMGYNDSFIIAQ